ncbi:hypothetical protein [Streptomyces sp. C]|uniref:hypothetical protein n=1 Tax=Streptomyces sp. C TaxID=253839 RepID=UPI0001DEF029|nr:hypothetical protein [Streptomyces sp. C]EFL15321.1 predicted protein [Streptomyces sp. C]
MSDAQVVGRVAVKVVPDTSGFKQQLKKQLEKIENDLTIAIQTKADPKGARADVLQIVRDINRDNKSTDVRKIAFYTRLDFHGMATEVKNAVQAYQNKANQHRIIFRANGKQVVDEARRSRNAAQAELTDLHLGVNLDSQGSVVAAVAKVKAALEALGETDIEIGLNSDDLNAGLDMFEERLDEIAHITLRVDEKSQGSINAAISEIERELSKLDEVELKVKLDRASLEAAKARLEKLRRLEIEFDPRSSNSVRAAIGQIDAELAKFKTIDLSVQLDEKALQKARKRLEKHLTLDLKVDKKSMSSVEAALAQVEEQLAELGREEIKVKLDKKSLLKAQAEMKAILETEARAKVAADREAAQKARDEIQAQMDGIKVRPKLDEKEVAATKRQLEAAFEQMQSLKAKITPELDAMEKRKVEREIDDLQDKIDKLKATVEPEVSHGAMAAVALALARLTRDRVVNLFPKVSLSAAASAGAMLAALSGGRVLGDIFEKLGNTLRNLDRSTPIIGTIATAIAGLSAWGISAASNLFTLSASLAQIGATSLALPGILGGMAIGLGATVAAFKDFNKVLPEVKGQFSKLQDLISSNFWDKAKEPIRGLIDTLLPELRDGFAKTSTQLGSFFGGFATSLKGALAPALGGMFDDLSKSIEIATGGTEHFASIIKILGEVGAGYLPRLAQWFVDVAEKADTWLKKKGESGLREEIDQGITALKDLGGVIYETGGIFAGLARAANEAGGSTLGMLRDTLAGIHEAVDSSGVQAKLVGLFTAAHDAMSNLNKVGGEEFKAFIGQFVGLLTQILPQVGTILGTAVGAISAALNQDEVFSGVYALFDGIQAAVNGLAPAMAPLGAAFGSLLKLVGALAAQLGPLVAAALTPLAEGFTALAPSILPIIELLGGALTGVFQQLSPIIAALVPVISEALGQAFTALSAVLPIVAEAFMQIMTAVAPLVAQLISGLAPILPVVAQFIGAVVEATMPLVSVLLEILQAVLLPLIPVVQNIAATMLPLLAEAWGRLVEAAMPFLEAIKSLIDFLMPVLAPAIQFIAELLVGSLISAINGVSLILEGLKQIFSGAFDYIMAVFEFWKDLFTGNWDELGTDVLNILKSMWEIIKGLWNTILGAFLTWLSVGVLGAAKKGLMAIKEAFKSGWKAVVDFGKSAWASISEGFSGFFSGLGSKALSGLGKIKQFFSDGWTSIRTTAMEKFTALVKTIEEWIGKGADKVAELPKLAKEKLGSLASTLKDAGIALIKGFISGIAGMFGAVKDKLGELTDLLPDWKGPKKKDSVLLYDAGRLIIKGLIKGLESEFDNVKKSLNDLTAKIPKNASKALKDRIGKDRTALLQLAAQWDGLSKKLEAARDKLKKLREDLVKYKEQVADRIISLGDVTKADDSSFEGVTSNLKNAVDQAKKFAAVLKRLKDLGLNQATFDQIAMAGPEAGLAAAESIANAGVDGVLQINELQKDLEKYANAAGSTAAHYMYDAGIRAAEGIVKGLEKQQDAIEKQMLKIADAMVNAIKKALDIHSPSRLFRKLGNFVGLGFGLGVEDQAGNVERASNALAESATSGASRSVSAAVSGGLAAAGPGQSVTKVLNYYAGSGNSLSSEEELFAATSRARMVGW